MFKNILAGLSLIVSAFAAVFAYRADVSTRELDERLGNAQVALSTERFANELLEMSMPYLKDMRHEDDNVAQDACFVVVELSSLQIGKTAALGENNTRRDIESILQSIWAGDSTNRYALCLNKRTEQETLIVNTGVRDRIAEALNQGQMSAEEAKVFAESEIDATLQISQTAGVGQWHAVMASYQSQNCALAQTAAAVFQQEFKDALAAQNRIVSIFRTSISDHYAVTIDTGNDKALASAWVSDMKSLGQAATQRLSAGTGTARDSQNLRFLTGAFVQEDRGWSIDDACPVIQNQ